MRTKLLAVVATACLVLGGLSVANAAQLLVSGGSISTAEAGPCADRVAVAWDGWVPLVRYSQVTFTLPPGCQDRSLMIVVNTGAANPPRVSLPLGTSVGPHTLTLSANPYLWDTAFALIIDGWEIDT